MSEYDHLNTKFYEKWLRNFLDALLVKELSWLKTKNVSSKVTEKEAYDLKSFMIGYQIKV